MIHWRMHTISIVAVIVAFIITSPSIVMSATDSRCVPSTQTDKNEMQARGIPQSFQVCPEDRVILGIGQNFDQWYSQLKSNSPCNKNTCTLSCRTRNTGAQVCGPVASKWNSIGCHSNNNTAIFPSVPYGFAAHIELLRNYCGKQGRCTITSVINKWAATTAERHSAYSNFVSRTAGIPVNQVFDPNNIELMGRLALSMACFEAGAMPYKADELKQGLVMAAGGKKVPVPSNVGELLNESQKGSYSANPNYSSSDLQGFEDQYRQNIRQRLDNYDPKEFQSSSPSSGQENSGSSPHNPIPSEQPKPEEKLTDPKNPNTEQLLKDQKKLDGIDPLLLKGIPLPEKTDPVEPDPKKPKERSMLDDVVDFFKPKVQPNEPSPKTQKSSELPRINDVAGSEGIIKTVVRGGTTQRPITSSPFALAPNTFTSGQNNYQSTYSDSTLISAFRTSLNTLQDLFARISGAFF